MIGKSWKTTTAAQDDAVTDEAEDLHAQATGIKANAGITDTVPAEANRQRPGTIATVQDAMGTTARDPVLIPTTMDIRIAIETGIKALISNGKAIAGPGSTIAAIADSIAMETVMRGPSDVTMEPITNARRACIAPIAAISIEMKTASHNDPNTLPENMTEIKENGNSTPNSLQAASRVWKRRSPAN
ncbi:MAG: hypothetical protein ACOX1O_07945 [Eggerthellaceae bacterium]